VKMARSFVGAVGDVVVVFVVFVDGAEVLSKEIMWKKKRETG
jgi:hypothetical protein